jgi:two-component system nitrate/nitrite response regulator NarL
VQNQGLLGCFLRQLMAWVTIFASNVDEVVMRILLVDDHDLVRDTLAAYLEKEPDLSVTTAADIADALDIVAKTGKFDLVLLDYTMPGMDGLLGLIKMLAANQDSPVAILSGTADRNIAEQAIRVGAAGFVPKTLAAKSIVSAVKFMASGEVFAPFGFMHREEVDGDSAITKRERDVLIGLTAGKSNKEIAFDLDLQEVTIKLHVKTLCRKLGAKNRTHAAMIARDRQLL